MSIRKFLLKKLKGIPQEKYNDLQDRYNVLYRYSVKLATPENFQPEQVVAARHHIQSIPGYEMRFESSLTTYRSFHS